jgi:hypothetical protein
LSDERGRRAGLNEALFREVNEQIRGLTDDLGSDGATITVICECGNADCTERIELRRAESERVRSDSLFYVIASGHEIPGVEQVVERRNGWEIVQKVGVAGEVAEETDPRS